MKKATNHEKHQKVGQPAVHDSPYSALPTELGAEWNFTAFEAWVGGCEDKSFRLAMHFLRDERAAQDILQETFLAAWENIKAFANRTRFNAWIYRTTVKAALERLNATRSRGQLSEDRTLLFLFTTREFWSRLTVDEDPNWSMRTPNQFGSEELLRHIRQAVDSLPLELRAAFILGALEEMSAEESADILDLPATTVRAQLQAAILAIRHAIGSSFARGARKSSPARATASDLGVSERTLVARN